MKTVIRLVSQGACIVLFAAGLLAALFSTFCVGIMAFIWAREGRLLPMDRPILVTGLKWLIGSCALITTAWWVQRRISRTRGDNSFRLVKSKSGRLEEWAQKISLIGLGIIFIAWTWPRVPVNGFMKVPVVAGWLVAGFFGLHVCTAFHELGHLAAAWIVGFDLRKMQIGAGPILRSYRFANRLLIQWRAWPAGGFMFATPQNTNGFRTRESLFIAGGPLADLIVLWTSYQLITQMFGGLAGTYAHGPGGVLVFTLFWLKALTAVGGLLPHKVRVDQHELWTDGYLLLRLLTGSGPDFTQFGNASIWKELMESHQSDCPRSEVPLAAIDMETYHASIRVFREQRTLLGSRLLRKASLTSSPRV